MKKLLLFAALFATAMVGKAQSFTVLHNNEPVENGSYIICTDPHDETDENPEDNAGYTYILNLYIENKGMNAKSFTGTLAYGSYPTKEEAADNDFVGETMYYKWGLAEICNSQNCFPEKDGYIGKGDIEVAGMSSNYFVYHLMSAPSELVSEYRQQSLLQLTLLICLNVPLFLLLLRKQVRSSSKMPVLAAS